MQLPSTLITDMEVVDPMQPLCKQILLNITYRSYLPSILKCLRLLNWPAWVQITSIFPFWDKDIFQFWLDFGASWAVPEVICHVATAWAVGPGRRSQAFLRFHSHCVCCLVGQGYIQMRLWTLRVCNKWYPCFGFKQEVLPVRFD